MKTTFRVTCGLTLALVGCTFDFGQLRALSPDGAVGYGGATTGAGGIGDQGGTSESTGGVGGYAGMSGAGDARLSGGQTSADGAVAGPPDAPILMDGSTTSSATGTGSQTGAQTQSESQTSTQTAPPISATRTQTATATQTSSAGQTDTQTGTPTASVIQTGTQTGTGTGARKDAGGPDSGNSDAGAASVPIVLASSAAKIGGIAVDRTAVYWIAYDSSVMKVPVGGGSPVILVPGRPASNADVMSYGIVVDSTNVYWVAHDHTLQSGSLATLPLRGGTPYSIDTGSLADADNAVNSALGPPCSIAVSTASAYWTICLATCFVPSGVVMTEPLTIANGGGNPGGVTPTALASGNNSPYGIVADAANIYWAESPIPVNQCVGGPYNAKIMKMPINGAGSTILASVQDSPGIIASNGTSVYWTVPAEGAVMKVSVADGSVTTLVSGQNSPMGIAVDAASVYWANSGGGAVMKMPAGGGASTVLASGQSNPTYIAVDATSVYWTTFNQGNQQGSIMKLTPK